MSRRAHAAVAVAVVAVAAVAITVLMRIEDDASSCRDAARDVLLVRQGKADQARLSPAVDRLGQGCTDADAPAQAAVNLIGMKRRGQALPLARDVVREEPQNYRGWLVLAAALPPDQASRARAARERARALNPALPR